MKTRLSLLFFLMFAKVFCQIAPVLGTPTVLPSSPSTTNTVKIITETTTAYYGTRISLGQVVDQTQKKIKLEGCYSTSMLPATRTYIDTFNVGILQAGLYNVEFIAYESASTQSCISVASNSISFSLNVNGSTTSLLMHVPLLNISISPNPFSNYISLIGLQEDAEAEVLSLNGSVLVKRKMRGDESIDLSNLTPGIYFLKITNENGPSLYRLVKTDSY